MMLDVQGLRTGYGRIPILNGVSFSVNEGEFIGILGHNGMGKTTLMKSLMGIVPTRSGSVAVGGADITHLKSHQRVAKGVGFVPQGRMIFSAMTVQENIETGLTVTGERRVPQDLYTMFPVLLEMKGRRGGNLSGGQQQQLAIARALVTRPKLLVLDEPTEGIQPSIIKDIGRAITYLRSRGEMAIVLVEQYLDFASELGDRFEVMDRGAVVYSTWRDAMDEAALKKALAI